MKFLSEKGSQRRYITAGKVLADIPAPKIARRVTAKPQSTLDGTKRLRAKSRGTPVTEPNLADLRAARKVLAIEVRNTAGGHGWIHPHFQFDSSGSPYTEIAGVLEAFGDADPLAICVWLSEPNPVLENHPPMHFMLTDRARVVQAAQKWREDTLRASKL